MDTPHGQYLIYPKDKGWQREREWGVVALDPITITKLTTNSIIVLKCSTGWDTQREQCPSEALIVIKNEMLMIAFLVANMFRQWNIWWTTEWSEFSNVLLKFFNACNSVGTASSAASNTGCSAWTDASMFVLCIIDIGSRPICTSSMTHWLRLLGGKKKKIVRACIANNCWKAYFNWKWCAT